MNCWRVQNLIAPFLEGELPAAECEAVGAHVEACADCLAVVEAVESLPALSPPRLPDELAAPLFEQFDRCLKERLAAGEEPPLGLGAALASAARREVRVPLAAAAAWLGVMVMLGGGVALNHAKVRDLQDSVARREAIIQALQERVAVAANRQDQGDLPPGRATTPVFLPASAPSALGSALPTGRFGYRQPGIVGASLRQASYDAPRIVR